MATTTSAAAAAGVRSTIATLTSLDGKRLSVEPHGVGVPRRVQYITTPAASKGRGSMRTTKTQDRKAKDQTACGGKKRITQTGHRDV